VAEKKEKETELIFPQCRKFAIPFHRPRQPIHQYPDASPEILLTLTKKARAMQGKVNSIRTNLKKVERRIDTLGEHLRHSENFKKYRKPKAKCEELYSQYQAARKATGFGTQVEKGS
jgi:hypothetical protein